MKQLMRLLAIRLRLQAAKSLVSFAWLFDYPGKQRQLSRQSTTTNRLVIRWQKLPAKSQVMCGNRGAARRLMPLAFSRYARGVGCFLRRVKREGQPTGYPSCIALLQCLFDLGLGTHLSSQFLHYLLLQALCDLCPHFTQGGELEITHVFQLDDVPAEL